MLFRGPALAPGPQEQFRLKTPKRAQFKSSQGGFPKGGFIQLFPFYDT